MAPFPKCELRVLLSNGTLTDHEMDSRLCRAFSLRAGLRGLLRPSAGRVAPLDGLRALSILWVVLFHTGWFSWHLAPDVSASLVHAPWMLPLWRGDFGVDVFFVLSGFLIAGMLIDERAETGRVRYGIFYARRLLRLWPAFAAASVIEFFGAPARVPMAWAALLYLNDFVSVVHAFMGWTWSLSIEEQFYLVCPWLLAATAKASVRVRLVVFAALVLALGAIAAVVVVRGPFFPFDAEIVINRPLFFWARAYDALYSKPWMRAAPLVAGVVGALLHRTPAVRSALARSRAGATAGLVLAIVAAAIATEWRIFAGAPRAVEVAYLASYRAIFGCSVAYVILLALSEHPIGRALGRILSARVLYPVAQLAYAAYLLNPFVAMETHRLLAPRITSPAHGMALLVPTDLFVTFALATVLHLTVERPFMQLRPGARHA